MTALKSMMGLFSLLFLLGCELKRDFNKGEPSAEAKGDRPQETGEGLPGYLIDPELLVLDKTEIKAAPRAVRTQKTGASDSQKVLAIGYKRSAKAFRRDKDTLIISGRLIASIQTQSDGSFSITAALENDETLFLRLADAYADNELAFAPGKAAPDRVMLDGATGKFVAFDSATTQTISYDIDPTGTQAAQIETLKATRSCRSCNLSGASLPAADLNGCVLVGSKLVGTDLTGADLRNCQLQNTDMTNANLTRADLSAADLTQAVLTNAILTDAILTNVKGYQAP